MPESRVVDVSRVIDEGKLPRYSILVAVICFFLILTEGYDNLAMSYVGPYIVKAWNITNMASLGRLFTANLFGFILGGVLYGNLGDRYGRRVAIICSALTISVFTALAMLSTSITELFILRFIAGLGLGGVASNAAAITAEFSPKRFRSTMIILMYAGVPAGSSLPGPVSAWIGPIYGWQALFFIGGILPFLAAGVAAIWLPESLKFLVVRGGNSARIARVIKMLRPGLALAPDVRYVVSDEKSLHGISPHHLFVGGLRFITPLVWLLYISTALAFYTTTSWLPTLLALSHLSPKVGALTLSAFTFGGLIGSIAICRPLDKIGFGALAALFAISIPAVGAVGFAIGSDIWLMVAAFLAGFCLLGTQAALNAVTAVIYPTGVRSMAMGWAHAVGKIAATSGPVLVGILLGLKWPIQDLFLLLDIPLGVGATAAFAMTRLYNREFGAQAPAAASRPSPLRSASTLALALAVLLGTAATGAAADKVTVGKAVSQNWVFSIADIGMSAGVFAQAGLDVDDVSFAGEAKLQQAMIGNSLDFGLAGGTSLLFSVKGVPAKAVAVVRDKGSNWSVTVPFDSTLAKLADLKGKRFGITTAGGLSEWVAKRMIQGAGWQPGDATLVQLGSIESMLAGLKTGQVDALFLTLDIAELWEEKKIAKPIFTLGKYTQGADMSVIIAHDDVIEKRPELVRRFLKAWFATVAFMKANKQRTVDISADVLHASPAVAAKLYDEQIDLLSTDGRFNPASVNATKQSFLDMGLVAKLPPDDAMLTRRFVPSGR